MSGKELAWHTHKYWQYQSRCWRRQVTHCDTEIYAASGRSGLQDTWCKCTLSERYGDDLVNVERTDDGVKLVCCVDR